CLHVLLEDYTRICSGVYYLSWSSSPLLTFLRRFVSASQVKLQIPMPTKTGVPFSLSIPIISGVAG
ncbi:hypothetical protein V3C99_010112, partial [Haemonchus contortus]|uniref:Ovule protein n=1 Tax=Haemonchus contortus TaxID=6289 RepID=A0A7I4YIQ1_HAECO